MFCQKNNFLYIHIPKCGGNSIKGFLQENLNTELEFDTWHYPYIFFEDKIKPEDFIKFSICRNPLDRFVSAFCYTYERVRNKQDYHWKQYPKTYLIFADIFENLSAKESFKSFVFSEFFEQIFEHGYPVHFQPQYKFIDCAESKLDFLGQIEDLQSFIDFCVETFKIKNPKQMRQKNTSKHASWESFYNEETKKIITKKYNKDFLFLRDHYNINYL
jgi:hypothetical protein